MDIERIIDLSARIVVAGIIAIFTTWFLSKIRINIGKTASDRVREIYAKDKSSYYDKVGNAVLSKLGLTLSSWENNLKWSKYGGKCLNWSVGGILGRGLMYASLGLFYVLITQGSLMSILATAILFYYPFMDVSTNAKKTKETIGELLPGLAIVITAELSGGNSISKTIEKCCQMTGPLGLILKDVYTEAQSSNRPMFTQGSARGVFPEIISELGLQSLTRFGLQLDRASAKGASSPEIVAAIAEGLTREYSLRLTDKANKLETELLIPTVIFFFIPMVASALVPMFLSALKLFS